MVHTERTEPKDYSTTVRDTYNIPTQHKDYISDDGKGPRQRAIEARLHQQVASETQAKLDAAYADKMQPRFETEAQGCYQRAGFKTRPLDGEVARVPTYSSNYATESPVTFYSHAVKQGRANFPVTFMPSGNEMFRRNAGFSTDIRNAYPHVAETHERPLPQTRCTGYKALQDLREKLLTAAGASADAMPGVPAQKLISFLDQLGSESPLVSLDLFLESIHDTFGVELSPTEIKAIETEFDGECTGTISCAEFLLLIRPSLPPRRLELVDIAFGVCDSSNKGSVSKGEALLVFDASKAASFLPTSVSTDDFQDFFLVSVFGTDASDVEATFDDFVEFFSNVSTATPDETVFEGLIKNMFSL
jgi:hypothetical protein